MKKEVLRRCIVTGESHPKNNLIRVVRTPEGNVIIDPTKKANGRGAYVVARQEAILLAKKKDAFARALETTTSEALYEALLELVRES
ncbi:MAG: YlxR family protein [Bacilli bacterium]|jgi:predicted RNA-binding protein YlxR (DUF448 family)